MQHWIVNNDEETMNSSHDHEPMNHWSSDDGLSFKALLLAEEATSIN